jgi:hypothetical protein
MTQIWGKGCRWRIRHLGRELSLRKKAIAESTCNPGTAEAAVPHELLGMQMNSGVALRPLRPAVKTGTRVCALNKKIKLDI